MQELELSAKKEPNTRDFDRLWREFSSIQCATWIVIDPESMARFNQWKLSEDNDDAWS